MNDIDDGPVDQDTAALAIRPHDLETIKWVMLVMEKIGPENPTLEKACAAAGTNYMRLYRALQQPVIQGLVAQRLNAENAVVLTILDRSLIPVLMNLVKIATGPKAKEAVAAARLLLVDLRGQVVEEGAAAIGHPAGKSQAAMLLERAQRPITLTRKTVTEEIHLEPSIISLGNELDSDETIISQSDTSVNP